LALQILVNTGMPQILEGYKEVTMLDPHPARVNFPPWDSVPPGTVGWLLQYGLDLFQASTQDPEVSVPTSANVSEDYFQNTPWFETGSLATTLLNLWGESSVGSSETYDLTGPGINHSTIHDWYLTHVLGGASIQSTMATSASIAVSPNVTTGTIHEASDSALSSDVELLYPRIVSDPSVAKTMVQLLAIAQTATEGGDQKTSERSLAAFFELVMAQRGQSINPGAADVLGGMVGLIARVTGEPLTTGGTTPPEVHGVLRLGFHGQPTEVLLTFDKDLNPSAAETLANYRIVSSGLDGRFGARGGRSTPIRSVSYDLTTNTVTLTPARRLDLHRRYELIVNGSTPAGVTDVAGNLLDGAGSGKPGSDYVVVLRGFGRDEPGRPFRKLLRDQLGGKPMSSRRVDLRTSSRVSRQAHAGPAHAAAQHSLREERAAVPHGPLVSRRMRRSP
jgi:hypothetical protein